MEIEIQINQEFLVKVYLFIQLFKGDNNEYLKVKKTHRLKCVKCIKRRLKNNLFQTFP